MEGANLEQLLFGSAPDRFGVKQQSVVVEKNGIGKAHRARLLTGAPVETALRWYDVLLPLVQKP